MHDLAEVGRKILRLLAVLEAFADREQESAVGQEHHPRAEVVAGEQCVWPQTDTADRP